MYPEMNLLDYMVILFLIFLRIAILFSIAAESFYIPTNSKSSKFSISLSTFIILNFFIVAILMFVRWYLVVLMSIFLMISYIEHLFMGLLAKL